MKRRDCKASSASSQLFVATLFLAAGGIGFLLNSLGFWASTLGALRSVAQVTGQELGWACVPLAAVVLVLLGMTVKLLRAWPRGKRLTLNEVHALIKIEMAASQAGLLGAALGILVALLASHLSPSVQAARLVRNVALGVAALSPLLGLLLGTLAEVQIEEKSDAGLIADDLVANDL